MKPMLAYTPRSLEELRFPLLASPKLDGVRALNINGTLVSRKLKPIPNLFVQKHLSGWFLNGCDGELTCGPSYAPDVFRRTTSAVMSEGDTPQVTFWVFDRWDRGSDAYITRINHLPSPIDRDVDGLIRVRPLKHRLIKTREQLDAYEAYCLAKGYEGVMVRDPQGLYKHGRSGKTDKWLCKIKRFEDAEAVCIGIVEQKRNDNPQVMSELGRMKRSSHKANKVPKGTTGTLVCRTQDGVEFEIGTGMDDATRARLWAQPPIGKQIKFKFQPTGVKDRPRFPVYIGIRED